MRRALSRDGGVAVTALAFSDGVTPLVGWHHLRTAAEASAFADAPCQAEQEVIDLATDGEAA